VISAATIGKAAEEDRRHIDVLGLEFVPAVDRDMAAVVFCSTDRLAPSVTRSVWSRVATGSMTVVRPGVLRPASSTADFTWAEATGSL
jgi:hypothetical protein